MRISDWSSDVCFSESSFAGSPTASPTSGTSMIVAIYTGHERASSDSCNRRGRGDARRPGPRNRVDDPWRGVQPQARQQADAVARDPPGSHDRAARPPDVRGGALMVQLTRIYTRGGDKGETSLGTSRRVPKHDLRVAAYGTVDEANCVIGIARQIGRAHV